LPERRNYARSRGIRQHLEKEIKLVPSLEQADVGPRHADHAKQKKRHQQTAPLASLTRGVLRTIQASE
jgi:hypothetical protein